MENIRYMNIINHDYPFTENDHDNLKNYLKEEYKYSRNYDSKSKNTETAFCWNDSDDDSGDDWKAK